MVGALAAFAVLVVVRVASLLFNLKSKSEAGKTGSLKGALMKAFRVVASVIAETAWALGVAATAPGMPLLS